MRLLLDENVPRKLKFRLTRFGAATVQEMGWSGITNGELLARMTEAGFDVLLTGFHDIPRTECKEVG